MIWHGGVVRGGWNTMNVMVQNSVVFRVYQQPTHGAKTSTFSAAPGFLDFIGQRAGLRDSSHVEEG